MKRLQLFTLIALLTAATCHNYTYPWSWSSSGGNVTYVQTGRGITIINGQIINPSNGPVIEDAGELETKEVNIAGVRSIDTSGWGNLTIEQCASCPEILTIIADKNIMPHLKHEVNGIYSKQLNLGFKDQVVIRSITPINFHAVVKDINKISNSGTLDIQSKGTIKTNSLDIDKSGTGAINMSVDVQDLTVDHSGTGTTELSGTANKQKINFSGTGNYKAYNLISQDASVNLSGVGNAYVNVKNKLSYRLSGIGNLSYKGNPTVNGSKSGLGKIKKT